MLLPTILRRGATPAAAAAAGRQATRSSKQVINLLLVPSTRSRAAPLLPVLPTAGAAGAGGQRRLLVTGTRHAGRRKRPLGGGAECLLRLPAKTSLLRPQTRGYFVRRLAPDGEGIVYVLIGANVLGFAAWTWASTSRKWSRFMSEHFTVSAVGVLEEGKLHTLFTSMFSHKSFGHLLVNSITLYFFGAEAAILLGARRFLALYLTGGLASSLCCVAWPFVAPKLDIPASYRVSKWTASLGASGALNAIVAWSILTFPTRMIYVYLVLPVPAALVGGLFLVKDLSGLYQGGSGEANAGHLGGAVVGAVYFFLSRGRGGRF